MIEDLKIAIMGWYLGIAVNMSEEDIKNGIAWKQPEMKEIMEKYKITKEDVIAATPSAWIGIDEAFGIF